MHRRSKRAEESDRIPDELKQKQKQTKQKQKTKQELPVLKKPHTQKQNKN